MGKSQIFLRKIGKKKGSGFPQLKLIMKWYDDLYVGDSIIHRKKQIKWKILHNAGQINIYIITIAANKKNLLDIIPSRELLQKGYPKKELFIIGLAKGYEEAIEVAASIVDEVYRQTGAFDIVSYLSEKSGACLL